MEKNGKSLIDPLKNIWMSPPSPPQPLPLTTNHINVTHIHKHTSKSQAKRSIQHSNRWQTLWMVWYVRTVIDEAHLLLLLLVPLLVVVVVFSFASQKVWQISKERSFCDLLFIWGIKCSTIPPSSRALPVSAVHREIWFFSSTNLCSNIIYCKANAGRKWK